MNILQSPNSQIAIYFKDELQQFQADCWFAGGCIRDYLLNTTPTDYDVFFPNEIEFLKAKSFLLNENAEKIWESDNGVKFRYNDKTYDLVKIFNPSPAETIRNFDFTACMFAVYNDTIFYGEQSFDDLQKKTLVINIITFPNSSLKRAFKYCVKYNFGISVNEINKLYNIILQYPKQIGEGNDYLNLSGDSMSGGGGASEGGTPEEKNKLVKNKIDNNTLYIAAGAAALVGAYFIFKPKK